MDSGDAVPQRKALQINLNEKIFGTFAEIGAGQEVVRHFFQTPGASGTIAKTISAYDMTFSDEIYGKSGRYVSKERLLGMLDHEYALLLQRLSTKRGHDTCFFAFADTVAARSLKGGSECHGWMGIRFRRNPQAPYSDIIIHVRMLDDSNKLQQEALGFVGVNLIHAAFFCPNAKKDLVPSLLEGLSSRRIEIDMIEVTGEAFPEVDNRLLSLQLVQLGLTNACMFGPSGKVLQPSEVLYKKAVLVERGSFKPVTRVHVDMYECARSIFLKDVGSQEAIALAELTLNNLKSTGEIDPADFLARVDTISSLGWTVMVSNYSEFYSLIGYLRRYTKQAIGLALGVNTLLEIFNEKHYSSLDGGLLESIGKLFSHSVKLYVYPMIQQAFDEYAKLFSPQFDPRAARGQELLTAKNLPVLPETKLLYSYLLERGLIVALENFNKDVLSVMSRDILRRIAEGDPSWETVVPPPAASLIKRRALLGFESRLKPAPTGLPTLEAGKTIEKE